MKGGGTRYGLSYGAGSVKNAGFARSTRGFKKMNGTRSNLPYALGVSMEQIRNKKTGLRKNDKKRAQMDHYHPQSPSEATPSSPGARSRDLGDATSESDEDEAEGVEWGKRMYGVRMSPAHPRYVGRGDDTCGGEVVYTIPEMMTRSREQMAGPAQHVV
jgi:hypothetical protein